MAASSHGRRSLVGAFVAGFLPLYTVARWVPALWAVFRDHGPTLAATYAMAYPVQALTTTTAALIGAALVHRRAQSALDAADVGGTRQTLLMGALAATLTVAFEWGIEAIPIPMPLGIELPPSIIVFAAWSVGAVVTGIAGASAARLTYLPWLRRSVAVSASRGGRGELGTGDEASVEIAAITRAVRSSATLDT